MDVDHPAAKAAGLRVGLFGDSYVESLQVPLEQVFFRRLLPMLGGSVEPFGYGMSGWGTLQAFQAFRVFAPRDHLDVAVYLFVENDLGDNDLVIARHGTSVGSGMPFAVLSADGRSYETTWVVAPGRESFWYAPGKWLQRHSLPAHLVIDRLENLRSAGVRVHVRADDVQMTGAASGVPNADDLQATWPEAHRQRVETLGALLLRDWKTAADAQNIRFLVLDVPRGETQLRGKVLPEQTWLPWLRATCSALRIPLLDPSEALRNALESGQAVYEDHWTPAGHETVARVLAAGLRPLRARDVSTPATAPAP